MRCSPVPGIGLSIRWLKLSTDMIAMGDVLSLGRVEILKQSSGLGGVVTTLLQIGD